MAYVPLAAPAALQALRDKGQIRPGQNVLINGAAGGADTFAVQIAKSFGADVTGVCSTRNVGMVRSIGADRVIDYTQENFTKAVQRYGLIFDMLDPIRGVCSPPPRGLPAVHSQRPSPHHFRLPYFFPFTHLSPTTSFFWGGCRVGCGRSPSQANYPGDLP